MHLFHHLLRNELKFSGLDERSPGWIWSLRCSFSSLNWTTVELLNYLPAESLLSRESESKYGRDLTSQVDAFSVQSDLWEQNEWMNKWNKENFFGIHTSCLAIVSILSLISRCSLWISENVTVSSRVLVVTTNQCVKLLAATHFQSQHHDLILRLLTYVCDWNKN